MQRESTDSINQASIHLGGVSPIVASSNTGKMRENYEQGGYLVRVSASLEIEELKTNWLRLEKGNPVPFFLTWHWVSCWIKTYQPDIIMVTASRENQVVAIGLFTSSLNYRYGFVKARQLRLHQLGNIPMDQIWMEYNDFICDSQHRENAVDACLKVLQRREFNWDEIVLPMMPRSRAEHLLSSIPLASVGLTASCFAVDLSEIRDSDREYLQFLTSNTRYQIKRSMRLYEKKYGPLELIKANNREEGLRYFRDAGKFHVLRWSDSGYKNQYFVKFHENLIRDSFEEDSIHLLKLMAGNETIAVMYNQIVDRKVFFYLHGLKFDNDGRLKPGLVAHTLATEYYIRQGMLEYDYMGGDSQYKIQLAQRTEDLKTVIIQRPRLRFSLEKIARSIKRRILPVTP